jgi:hypothetical protein
MIVKQFRYYTTEDYDILNQPDTITEEDLISGLFLENITCDEIKIKTHPGVICYINEVEILIGDTGNYWIPIEEKVNVFKIQLAPESIQLLKDTRKYFIITLIAKEK